jgi:sec-independent protein translocase protein TatC
LQELRTRLIRAFIAIGLGFIVAYLIADPLFHMLTWPIREVSGGKVLLIGTGVGEAFYTKIKVALIAGLFIASPAVFYEIWKFIAPGLYETASIGVTPTIRISEYLAFSSKLLLAFALTFEMPIFAFFFTKLGMIDYKMMFRFWRYAILAIFIVSAALTPPDMISQFLLAIPLLVLYALSVGVAWAFRLKPDEKTAATTPEPSETI